MQTSTSDAIEFRWYPPQLKWLAGLLLVIGVLGLVMLREEDAGVKALGAIWTVLFAWGACCLLRRVFDRQPVVTVSAAGLMDRRIMDAVIPWAAILRVDAFDAEHVPFIGLEFHDPKAALSSARPMVRSMAPLHRLLRFPSASLQMSLLDGSGEDLLAAIRQFRPDLVGSHG